MLLVFPVKIPDNVCDGTATSDDASASSLAKRNSAQPAFHSALNMYTQRADFFHSRTRQRVSQQRDPQRAHTSTFFIFFSWS